jgi:hypothetical protein
VGLRAWAGDPEMAPVWGPENKKNKKKEIKTDGYLTRLFFGFFWLLKNLVGKKDLLKKFFSYFKLLN